MRKVTKRTWVTGGIAVAALVVGHGVVASLFLRSAVVERAEAAGWQVTMGHALSLYPGQLDIGDLEAKSTDARCSIRVVELDGQITLLSLFSDPSRLRDVTAAGVSITCHDAANSKSQALATPRRGNRPAPAIHAGMLSLADVMPTAARNEAAPPAELLLTDVSVEVVAVRYGSLSVSGPWTAAMNTAMWNGQALPQLSGVHGAGNVSMRYDDDTLITDNLEVVVQGNLGVPTSDSALQLELQATGITLGTGPQPRWHCHSPVRMSLESTDVPETAAPASPTTADVAEADTSVAKLQTAKVNVSAERCAFFHPDLVGGEAELTGVQLSSTDILTTNRNPNGGVPFVAKARVASWPVGEATVAGELDASGTLVLLGSEVQMVRVQEGTFGAARVSWPGDVNVGGSVAFNGTADLSAAATGNTWSGSARLSGPDAAPLFQADALGALPQWVTEKFNGFPFELRSNFKTTPHWLVIDGLQLERGSILAQGWLMRAREEDNAQAVHAKAPDAVGALVMNYAGLVAGVELYGERTTLVHTLSVAGNDTIVDGSEWLADRQRVLPQQAWQTAVPLP